ncbi:hypothetical protein ACSBR1_008562 [Camellia fascicularis]
MSDNDYFVLEELNVKSIVPCNDPLKYASLRAEPEFSVFGKRLGKSMPVVAKEVKAMSQEDILAFEKCGEITVAAHSLKLTDIKMKSQTKTSTSSTNSPSSFVDQSVVPGDVVLDLSSMANQTIKLGVGLHQNCNAISVTKVGKLRFVKPNKYWVKSSQKRASGGLTDVARGLGYVESEVGLVGQEFAQPNPGGSASGKPSNTNPDLSRVFALLRDRVGCCPIVNALGVSVEDTPLHERVAGGRPVGMSPSSGSAVTGSQSYHAQLHQVGAMAEAQSHDEGGCKDRREAVDMQTEGRWVDVAVELALVVRPEVPCSGEVGVDVGEEDDVSDSWRDGAPTQDVVEPMKHNGKSVRELRKLECSINYDQKKGGNGRGTRKGLGN